MEFKKIENLPNNNKYKDLLYKFIQMLQNQINEDKAKTNTIQPIFYPNPQFQNINPQFQNINPQFQNINPQFQNLNPQLQNTNQQLQNTNPQLQNLVKSKNTPAIPKVKKIKSSKIFNTKIIIFIIVFLIIVSIIYFIFKRIKNNKKKQEIN
jgi:ATP-dependent Zn protease